MVYPDERYHICRNRLRNIRPDVSKTVKCFILLHSLPNDKSLNLVDLLLDFVDKQSLRYQ